MSHSKYRSPKRNITPILCVLLILAALSTCFCGAWAYLLHSADSPVSNQFTPDNHPVISVNGSNQVSVTDTDYSVYLRAAVTVNWKGSGNTIILAAPAEGTDYSVTTGNGWSLQSDGFYYYSQQVTEGSQTTPVVTVTQKTSRTGYSLVTDIAVQAVQALGTVDGGTTSAVLDAWDVTP